MKIKHFFIFLMISGILGTFSCHKKDLFEQPDIEITGYTLLDAPQEYTHLEINMLVYNNDKRDATIKDVEYQVEIEGVLSEMHEAVINKVIAQDPLELTLPLTLKTSDAVKLLAKLDKGEELNYSATGTFHVDDPVIKLFDWPIDVSGTAYVEAGFEEFYELPDLTVDEITGDYVDNGDTYTFDLDVTTTVHNNDPRSVVVDEVEYVVTVEGIESETHYYSDSYSTDLSVAGNGTATLNLPLTLNVTESEGETLANAINAGPVDYTVEGILHVINVDGTAMDFMLPMYLTGSTTIDLGDMFQQPTVEITGVALLELPGEYTHMNITMLVTNNDSREAFITDINYQPVIEGITAQEEQVDINETLLPGTPLELTLPLTLLTDDAIQLLTMLDAGQSLDYSVTGIFHVDEPVLNLFDLPIDITGTADVDVGFEDFFEQPETNVTSFNGNFSVSGIFPNETYTIDLDVNCTVQNMDTHNAIIDEVVYVVTVEGVESNEHIYSNNISINGGQTIALTLPVTLVIQGSAAGLAFISKLSDGYADYVVEGTFHTIEIDGQTSDVMLPLYDEGTAPVTGFTIKK